MKDQGSYVPPPYIPLGQSDREQEAVNPVMMDKGELTHLSSSPAAQWSSGICACCDDMESCCIGLFCPCYLFAKNAEVLGSGTFMGAFVTHLIVWAFVNALCCLLTDGMLLGAPGCFVACYACNYREALRSKYNLQEVPCGDFTTHFFCHLCALCQEYRELHERSGDPNCPDPELAVVTAPPVQKMNSASASGEENNPSF
ncbi:hypothetical protein Dimus_002369 [Dionaea muscipula]